MAFTERFLWIFEHRGTNKSRLAHESGLSRSHIRDILEAEKRGEMVSPRLETLQAIAQAAKVSLAWLATGDGSPDDHQTPHSPPVREDTNQKEYKNFGALPGWAEAEAEARRLYGNVLPALAWEAAREMAGTRWPSEITAQTVYWFARAWFEQAREEELITRQRAELQRQNFRNIPDGAKV